MLANQPFLLPSSEAFACPDNGLVNPKRKRRPAGTPDPDAEVVYLSPEMLMESDRYVCEICKQSFQREQNLQMHRRRHKVPWKLLKRDKQQVNKKRVYVCPEPTCLHHDPSHALGDLVGIKKHFRRKHSNQKQFVCEKCSKGYAVQSDYKAHLKICGTKGHSCDCGRVFSRVETFIEHQDTCKARSTGAEFQLPCMSKLSPGFSGNSNFTRNPLPDPLIPKHTKPKPKPKPKPSSMLQAQQDSHDSSSTFHHNLDLGLELFSSNLSSPSSNKISPSFTTSEYNHGDQDLNEVKQYNNDAWNSYFKESIVHQEPTLVASRLKNEASQLLRMAMEQKALAEKKRQEAKCLIELAKQDMTNARKIREQVLALQLDCAATKKPTNNCRLLQVTCHACNTVFQTVAEEPAHGKALTAHVVNVSSSSAMKDGAKGNEGFLLWPKELASRS